jgi:hypothetical protein
MKNLTKLAVLLAAVCLLSSVGLGQQKSIRKTRKPTTTPPKSVCSVDTVPSGMVIVGYRDNVGCTSGTELLVKRPDASETVCANSPIPAGYIVQSINGSIECREASPNPLTNALVITRGGQNFSTSAMSNSEPIYSRSTSRREITVNVSRGTSTDDEEPPTSSGAAQTSNSQNSKTSRPVYSAGNIKSQGQRTKQSESTIEPDSDLEPASPIPSREAIEIAVRRSTVIIGMTMQDVSRAWGKSHTTDSLVESDGLIHIWGYRLGKVYFRNGLVYKILLLKG